MPRRSTPQELMAAAADAFGADRRTVRAMLREVRQRAENQARERARKRLEAILPKLQNGRTVRATFTPAVARRRDLAAPGRAGDRQALATIRRQRDALEALRRSHAALAKKMTVLQAQAGRTLIGLLHGLADFKTQLHGVRVREQSVRADRLSIRARAIRQQRELQSLVATSRLQQVTAVVNSLQGAAYGQKGRLLATNNLLLAANQLLWISIDPLLRRLGILHGPSPSLVTWLAPLGSLATGHLALGNRQHVRFISGVTTFEGATVLVREPLRDRIADDVWPKFQRRTDVPVTVVPLDQMGGAVVTATVQQGVLEIRLFLPGSFAGIVVPPRRRVAWMVDVGGDLG